MNVKKGTWQLAIWHVIIEVLVFWLQFSHTLFSPEYCKCQNDMTNRRPLNVLFCKDYISVAFHCSSAVCDVLVIRTQVTILIYNQWDISPSLFLHSVKRFTSYYWVREINKPRVMTTWQVPSDIFYMWWGLCIWCLKYESQSCYGEFNCNLNPVSYWITWHQKT